MILRTPAIYENGVLRPLCMLPVMDGERVELVVIRPVEVDRNSPERIELRRRNAQKLEETLAKYATDEEDGPDILQVLDEARRRIGARPLLPDPPEETK